MARERTDGDGFPSKFLVEPGTEVSLERDFDPGFIPEGAKKRAAAEMLAAGIEVLARYQDMLYAQSTYALLVILQARDAAGKDGVIKHVMRGLNPQGTQVYSFKQPSAEELDHDYLWRNFKALPERGRIGIFNRSYYEEVLVPRVHPQVLAAQPLPPRSRGRGIWRRRFREINDFERYLVANGIVVVKFFLNVSREEQKKRFMERIERPEKNWKLNMADIRDRERWDDYTRAYDEMLTRTSTKRAPWHVIPADRKWFTRLAVAAVLAETMKGLGLRYPEPGPEARMELEEARAILEAERG